MLRKLTSQLLLMTVLVGGLCLFGQPLVVHAQGGDIFLPLVATGTTAASDPGGDPVPPPDGPREFSSIQLIDQALMVGQVSEEQALLYRVQAVVGDPALPKQYVGDDRGLDGSIIMADIVERWDTLSAATQAQLQPYLLPPAAPGSWFASQTAAAAGQAELAQEWDTVTTANGKVKVWYRTATASHGARAVAIAGAIDSKIWPTLKAWMGREPLEDCGAACTTGGGDGRIDIYITNTARNYTQPFTCCSGSSGFAVLRADASFARVASALMYIWEYSYEIASLQEYRWLMRASAQFAIHHVYPASNQDPDYPAMHEEHQLAGEFLYRTLYPLETVDDGHEYGAYLLFQWLDDPSTVRDVWESATNPDSLAVINDQIYGGFEWGWPRFSVDNWNREPADFYRRTDALTIGPEVIEDFEMNSPGTEEFVIDIPRLTSYYFRFTFPDRSLKRIAVYNPIAGSGEPTGAMWAIMKIDGTWRSPQDWSQTSHEIFCRDEPNQNLEELIIVLANSEWQDREHTVKTDNGSVRVSPDCGGLLTGTFTVRFDSTSQMPSGARGEETSTTVINVRLRYDEEAEAYVDAGSTFNHSASVFAEGREVNTGKLGYIIEWTESGSGTFTQEGTQINGSVAYHDGPDAEDEVWIGATIRLRKIGQTTYYPNEVVVPIDGEENLSLLCNHPTGVIGKRTENGVFDMTCTVKTNTDTANQTLSVSGTLRLE
jgi:hypothetical protein